ncbi:acetolactate decarboxylase (plasmid) [Fructilactobacillus vespulae]|uniref:acetolactate decarboxylase n=1 Tax=Fructilactobacillus vespulae TaxID=1249630 RepID=UPI0039B6CF97
MYDKKNILFQHGTMQILAEGLLDGTISLKSLLEHGNTGIGTGEGIDGELIILNNVAYRIDTNGKAIKLNDNFMVPFANVNFANYTFLKKVKDEPLNHLLSIIEKEIKGSNKFFSIKINGCFEEIKTRSAGKSSKPYPSLKEVAKKQVEFYGSDITGTVVSYHTPKVFQGVGVAGFHSHFLSDDLNFGGHILSAYLNYGVVEIQVMDTFEQHLPNDNLAYQNANLSNLKHLDEIIKKSE